MAFLLFKWAVLLALSIALAEIQNVPTLFTKTLLPSSGLASPELPLLQIPGEAFFTMQAMI